MESLRIVVPWLKIVVTFIFGPEIWNKYMLKRAILTY